MGEPKNFDLLMEIYNRNAFLAENQNGPYGPYEQLLKDGKEISDKKQVTGRK